MQNLTYQKIVNDRFPIRLLSTVTAPSSEDIINLKEQSLKRISRKGERIWQISRRKN